ncbi:MAG: LysM peptidoglycan-binding domain-containing protein [Candidatus Omnitrophica bacterium]|nr:LysM peptidoglycan-binding domain-containing protein [Candidatus Omnitrophota bacterium]
MTRKKRNGKMQFENNWANLLLGFLLLCLSGCYTLSQTPLAPQDEGSLRTQVRQAKAIAETGLEISKESEQLSRKALEAANQAVATAGKALEAANQAISAANEAREFASKEATRAIEAANQASQKAIESAKQASEKATQAAREAAEKAMDHADKAAREATKAANDAIAEANKAITRANELSEKAMAMSNQILAEINRERATRRMAPPEEPILQEEPLTRQMKTYRVKSGDTLSKIARKVYGNPNRWQEIYRANRQRIKNPDRLDSGLELIIP